jgi:hypothetical protein
MRSGFRLLAVKQSKEAAGAFSAKGSFAASKAGSAKVGSEEKFGQAALEYLYERNQFNDGKKRAPDVAAERQMSLAFDRLCGVGDRAFEARLDRLTGRMAEALEAMPDELRGECLVLHSQQPPLNYRRPTLSPPVAGYAPGFGLDVAQMRGEQAEYPATARDTDAVEDDERAFPFVDSDAVAGLTADVGAGIERLHGTTRSTAPLTGTAGEAWEAQMLLQKRALARQRLLLDLSNDGELQERYDGDAAFRAAELERRGVLPLSVEDEVPEACFDAAAPARAVPPQPTPLHYSQAPKYQPFRN